MRNEVQVTTSNQPDVKLPVLRRFIMVHRTGGLKKKKVEIDASLDNKQIDALLSNTFGKMGWFWWETPRRLL